VVALGGLLVMHAFDAGLVDSVGVATAPVHDTASAVAPETGHGLPVPIGEASARSVRDMAADPTPDATSDVRSRGVVPAADRAAHLGLGHVVAACVAAVLSAAAGAIGRLVSRLRCLVLHTSAGAGGWFPPPPARARPPGHGHLELCVLIR
jgi:hypothetical protein